MRTRTKHRTYAHAILPSDAVCTKNFISGSCRYCGKFRKLTLDHIVPKCRNGETVLPNLTWCCFSCNAKKGSKDLFEWLESLPKSAPQRELLNNARNVSWKIVYPERGTLLQLDKHVPFAESS